MNQIQPGIEQDEDGQYYVFGDFLKNNVPTGRAVTKGPFPTMRACRESLHALLVKTHCPSIERAMATFDRDCLSQEAVTTVDTSNQVLPPLTRQQRRAQSRSRGDA